MNYYAFGLCFQSSDLLIPELPSIPPSSVDLGTGNADLVLIQEDDPGQWPLLSCLCKDEPELRMQHGELQLDIESIGRFRVTNGCRISWSRWSSNVSDQDIRSYLLGSALGALLIQRGMLVLHGNAMTKKGQAIVCVGDSGAGKSTLAYALMCDGWDLLADDLVAITPNGMVLPGVQRIKLWKDAAEAFGLDPSKLVPIQAGVEKYQLSGEDIRAAPSSAPISVCYVLPDEEPEDRPDQDSISVQSLGSDRDVMALLMANVYRPHFVVGLGMQGSSFLAIASLMKTTQKFRLMIPSGVKRLPGRLIGAFDLLKPNIL